MPKLPKQVARYREAVAQWAFRGAAPPVDRPLIDAELEQAEAALLALLQKQGKLDVTEARFRDQATLNAAVLTRLDALETAVAELRTQAMLDTRIAEIDPTDGIPKASEVSAETRTTRQQMMDRLLANDHLPGNCIAFGMQYEHYPRQTVTVGDLRRIRDGETVTYPIDDLTLLDLGRWLKGEDPVVAL